MLMGRLGRYFPGNKPMLGMDHFIFERGGGGNYQKKFIYSKSREKKSCIVGQGKKIEQAFLREGTCWTK